MIEPIWLTVRLAAVTTIVLLVLGAPLAYWLATSRFKLRPLIEATVALPLVLPPTVIGYYMLVAMGQEGFLGRFWQAVFQERLAFSFEALVLASLLYSLPFAVQPMQAAFAAIDKRVLEAAWTLGASRTRTFFRVVLPMSVPGLVAAGVLTFAHTLGEFGVVLMVGGNIPGETRTVSIAIYDFVEALEYEAAGQLSLLLLGLSYAVLAAFYLFNRKVFQLWRPS